MPEPLCFHDHTHDQFQALLDSWSPKGWRLQTFSGYGAAGGRLFAGVLFLNDPPLAQQIRLDVTADQVTALVATMQTQDLYPAMISVTGSYPTQIYDLVFEEPPDTGLPPVCHLAQTPQAFAAIAGTATSPGTIVQHALDIVGNEQASAQPTNEWRPGLAPRSVALYPGGSGTDPGSGYYASTWWPAPLQRSSTVHYVAPGRVDEMLAAMDAQRSRLVFLAPTWTGGDIMIFASDSGAHDITPCVSVSSSAYQDCIDIESSAGRWPVCVQGVGTVPNVRISAVFTSRPGPLQRLTSITGSGDPSLTGLDGFGMQLLQRGGGRAGQLVVTRAGRVAYDKAFTWAEPGYSQTGTDSVFRVASVSKMITAIVACQLARPVSGTPTLDLDAPVLPLLQKLAAPPGQRLLGAAGAITTRLLLLHRSGLPHGAANLHDVAAAWNTTLPITDKYLQLGYLLADGGGPAQGLQAGYPSALLGRAYSNPGYTLAGLVIEQVTGLPYNQAVQKHLLTPLGIADMHIAWSQAGHTWPREATYDMWWGPQVGPSEVTPDAKLVPNQYGAGGDIALDDAAGGWVASARSLALIAQAVVEENTMLLSAAATAELRHLGDVWDPYAPAPNARATGDVPIRDRFKGGADPGTSAGVLLRDDRLCAAWTVNFDNLPAGPDMTASGTPNTYTAFQVNEHLNAMVDLR